MKPSILLMIVPVVLFFLLAPGFITIPAAQKYNSKGEPEMKDNKPVTSYFHMKPHMFTQILVHTAVFALIWVGSVYLLNNQYCLVSY